MGSVRVTVGIDIGTTSIKAVAVDDTGHTVARSRVPHELRIPAADRMEHDADRVWRRGPRMALRKLGPLEIEPTAIAVAAMVPSLTAVDRKGIPLTPGLLYGDARGRSAQSPEEPVDPADPSGTGEAAGFLKWTAEQAPDAHGYWPAQAVANRALGGAPAVDWAVAFTSSPLFSGDSWDADLCRSLGAQPGQMADTEIPGVTIGRLDGKKEGPVLSPGTVDVWCEQLVAGADQIGDVHVICGTTLIIWVVTPVGEQAPSPHPALWSVDHSEQTKRVGGASNAGGLFLDWVRRMQPPPSRSGHEPDPRPDDIPVWTPYPRGERTPYHDPSRRGALHDLNLTHGPAEMRRAAWEASGFVVRHHLDLAGVAGRRIVATGGGTRVDGWMHALADATGLPVHVAGEPEGAARGAAYLARISAGLESDLAGAARWASTDRVVDPDDHWSRHVAERYARFVELSGKP